jgi:ribosomal protein S17E
MRSKFINRYAKEMAKKMRGVVSTDYAKNKELIRGMEPNLSKRQVNEIAGYVTRLVAKDQAYS